MKGLGILINALTVFVAGGIGITFRGKLKPSFQKLSLEVLGVAVILLGAYNAWDAFFVISDGQFELTGGLLVIFSLLVGPVFGSALQVDRLIDRLGHTFEKKSQKPKSNEVKNAAKALPSKKEEPPKEPTQPVYDQSFASRVRKFFDIPPKGTYPRLSELPSYDIEARSGSLFTDGFALAVLLLCFNSMILNGTLADAAAGDVSVLLFKAAADFIFIFVLATVYGNGVTFAAIPMIVIQVGIFLIGLLGSDLLTPAMMDQMSLVGSVMLIALGINLTFGKRLRVANLAPAVLIPPIYYLIIALFEKTAGK